MDCRPTPCHSPAPHQKIEKTFALFLACKIAPISLAAQRRRVEWLVGPQLIEMRLLVAPAAFLNTFE